MPGLDETQTLRPLHADAQAGNRLLRVDEATDAVRALVEIRTAPSGAAPLERAPILRKSDSVHLGARRALPATGARPDRHVRARVGPRRSFSRDATPPQALLSSSMNPSKASSWAGSSKGPAGTTGTLRSGAGGGAESTARASAGTVGAG